MSKEAALRAMREARYSARMTKVANGTLATPTERASKPRAAAPVAPPAAAKTADGTDALCGHKSMNGRSCTREQGHTAKNHRYS